MVLKTMLAKALGPLDQKDATKTLIGLVEIIIDDAIVITTPMSDFGLRVLHAPRDEIGR